MTDEKNDWVFWYKITPGATIEVFDISEKYSGPGFGPEYEAIGGGCDIVQVMHSRQYENIALIVDEELKMKTHCVPNILGTMIAQRLKCKEMVPGIWLGGTVVLGCADYDIDGDRMDVPRPVVAFINDCQKKLFANKTIMDNWTMTATVAGMTNGDWRA